MNTTRPIGADRGPTSPKPAMSARDLIPWEGKAARGDKLLVGSIAGVLLLMIGSLPLRPWLIANHPIGLELATGSLSAIGVGAAFARIGEAPLWLVLAAGVIGMIKVNWLFWLAGRRWGARIVAAFAPGAGAQRLVERVRTTNPWLIGVLLVAASLPGVPAVLVYCLAGLHRTRLVTFLLLDALGALLMTGLVAGLGFGLGQYAVDVVLKIDDYSLWLGLAIALVIAVQAGRSAQRSAKAASEDAGSSPSA